MVLGEIISNVARTFLEKGIDFVKTVKRQKTFEVCTESKYTKSLVIIMKYSMK